jgi:broad specificity phosphatase PhoE/ribonuclease HI
VTPARRVGGTPNGDRSLIVEADGGSRGNPGRAGYGALVADAVTGEVLAEVAEGIGHATNNVAEYRGLIAGLRAAARIAPGSAVEARMDSKLVVEQMSGRWRIKHPDLQPLARAARDAASALGKVSYVWVPRERNRRADKLANEAMDGTERLPRGAPKRAGGAPPGASTARADSPAQPVDGGAARAENQAGPRPAARTATSAGTSAAEYITSGWAGRYARGGRPTTTVLLRHGQTALSVDKRFAGIGDIDLTELGARQARTAAQCLARRSGDAALAAIVTSPLRRARRTAEEAARLTGAPLRVEDDLRETDFGAWEGLSFAAAGEKWPAEMRQWLADADAAPPGGESLAAVERRVMAALDRLLARYAGATVLVVSHVTPIKTLVRRALLAPPEALYRMHLDTASLCEVDWYPDGPAVVRSLNDTAHLTADMD